MFKTEQQPRWWRPEYDAGWDRHRETFRQGWEAAGKATGSPDSEEMQERAEQRPDEILGMPPPDVDRDNFEEAELAIQFGYGARLHYDKDCATWNDDIEDRLEQEWQDTWQEPERSWQKHHRAVRHGWQTRLPKTAGGGTGLHFEGLDKTNI